MFTIRSAFSYDRRENSRRNSLAFYEESRAVQSFKEEADINTLVRRYGLMGEIPKGWRMPAFGDFSDIRSYQDMLESVLDADAAFMELPAEVRDRFANDPQRLFTFLSDDKNRDEAVKLGLVELPPVAPPVVPLKVVVVGSEPASAPPEQ